MQLKAAAVAAENDLLLGGNAFVGWDKTKVVTWVSTAETETVKWSRLYTLLGGSSRTWLRGSFAHGDRKSPFSRLVGPLPNGLFVGF